MLYRACQKPVEHFGVVPLNSSTSAPAPVPSPFWSAVWANAVVGDVRADDVADDSVRLSSPSSFQIDRGAVERPRELNDELLLTLRISGPLLEFGVSGAESDTEVDVLGVST